MVITITSESGQAYLGMFAKDDFLKCLPQDEDGKFDALQEMTSDILKNVVAMPLSSPDNSGGFNTQFKEKFLKFFNQIPMGEKFLITNDMLPSGDTSKAKFLSRVVSFSNQGKSFKDAMAAAHKEKGNKEGTSSTKH